MVLCFSVRGTPHVPSPDANNRRGELEWRKALYDRANEVRRSNADLHLDDLRDGQFQLDIVFLFETGNVVPGGDLDNLAKPVLDTLLSNENVRSSQAEYREWTGALLPHVEDRYVVRLNLRKRAVEGAADQGADIALWW